MNVENGGGCSWGENCAFAHSSEELSQHPHYNINPKQNAPAPPQGDAQKSKFLIPPFNEEAES